MNLGAAIKEIRKARRMTRKSLASASGISVTALYNIENDLSMPSGNNLQRICSALDVPMSYILVFSVEDEDVPEDKRVLFRQMFLMLKQFLLPKED